MHWDDERNKRLRFTVMKVETSSLCSSVPPTYGLCLGFLASIILHWHSGSAHCHPASAVWLASSGPRRCWVNPPWSSRPFPETSQEIIIIVNSSIGERKSCWFVSSPALFQVYVLEGSQGPTDPFKQWKVTLGGICFRQSTWGHVLECDTIMTQHCIQSRPHSFVIVEHEMHMD